MLQGFLRLPRSGTLSCTGAAHTSLLGENYTFPSWNFQSSPLPSGWSSWRGPLGLASKRPFIPAASAFTLFTRFSHVPEQGTFFPSAECSPFFPSSRPWCHLLPLPGNLVTLVHPSLGLALHSLRVSASSIFVRKAPPLSEQDEPPTCSPKASSTAGCDPHCPSW